MSAADQRPTPRDHLRGEVPASVAVVLYGDFQCPFTRQAYRGLQSVWRAQPDVMAWAFRHFPRPLHPEAWPAACVAEAAAAQGQYWPMADLLFRHQQQLSSAVYDELAERLELDLDVFARSRCAGSARRRIEDDLRIGRHGGVTTIPTLFVDGVRHHGDYHIGVLRDLLNAHRPAVAPVAGDRTTSAFGPGREPVNLQEPDA